MRRARREVKECRGLAICATPLALRRREREESHDRFDNWLMSRRLAGWHWSRIRVCSASRLTRSEEHTSELQSRLHLVCRLLLEKKKKKKKKKNTKKSHTKKKQYNYLQLQ